MANYSRSGLLNPRQNQRGLGVNRFLTNPSSTGYPGAPSSNNYGITPNVTNTNTVGQPNTPKKKRSLLQKIGGTLGRIGSGTNRFLQNWGGQSAPPGMDLTGSQKIGLLANRFKSMGHDAEGNYKDTVTPFLNNIASQNEYGREQQRRLDQLAAIRGSGMTLQQQDLMSSLPGDERSSAIAEYLEAQGGYGSNAAARLGSAGMNEIYFQDTDNDDEIIVGQVYGGADGGFLVNGKRYGGVNQEPIPDNWMPINSPTNSATLMAAIQSSVGGVEVDQAIEQQTRLNRVEFERLSNPEYLMAEADHAAWIAGAKERAISDERLSFEVRNAQLEALIEIENDLPMAYARTRDKDTHIAAVNSMVDRAEGMVSGWTTGFWGSLTDDIPGTPSHALAMQIMTIEANLGFDKLQAMRDASPTGGALGQVSERELDLLKAAVANLKQSNSQEDFRYNLAKVKEHNQNLWDAVEDDFRTKYGVEYFDPNAVETGREVIDRRISELLNPDDLTGVTRDDPLTGDELQRQLRQRGLNNAN